MASFFVKSVLFLLIVAPCVCSACFEGLWDLRFLRTGKTDSALLKGVSQTRPSSETAPIVENVPHGLNFEEPKRLPTRPSSETAPNAENVPHGPDFEEHKRLPTRPSSETAPNAENVPHGPDFEEHELVTEMVEHLAMETGENLANQYFGPSGKKGFRWGKKLYKLYCSVADKCEKFEKKLTSCTPIQKNRNPDCVLHCILEIEKNIRNNTPDSCSMYEDCDYPEEATCNLDRTDSLALSCTKIN